MKIADRVYLITDQLQTGAGIPGVIRTMEDDSMVKVAVEFTHGTKNFEGQELRYTSL